MASETTTWIFWTTIPPTSNFKWLGPRLGKPRREEGEVMEHDTWLVGSTPKSEIPEPMSAPVNSSRPATAAAEASPASRAPPHPPRLAKSHSAGEAYMEAGKNSKRNSRARASKSHSSDFPSKRGSSVSAADANPSPPLLVKSSSSGEDKFEKGLGSRRQSKRSTSSSSSARKSAQSPKEPLSPKTPNSVPPLNVPALSLSSSEDGSSESSSMEGSSTGGAGGGAAAAHKSHRGSGSKSKRGSSNSNSGDGGSSGCGSSGGGVRERALSSDKIKDGGGSGGGGPPQPPKKSDSTASDADGLSELPKPKLTKQTSFTAEEYAAAAAARPSAPRSSRRNQRPGRLLLKQAEDARRMVAEQQRQAAKAREQWAKAVKAAQEGGWAPPPPLGPDVEDDGLEGDLSFYEDEALERRAALMQHPVLIDEVSRIWLDLDHVVDGQGVKVLLEEPYVGFHRGMTKALVPDVKDSELDGLARQRLEGRHRALGPQSDGCGVPVSPPPREKDEGVAPNAALTPRDPHSPGEKDRTRAVAEQVDKDEDAAAAAAAAAAQKPAHGSEGTRVSSTLRVVSVHKNVVCVPSTPAASAAAAASVAAGDTPESGDRFETVVDERKSPQKKKQQHHLPVVRPPTAAAVAAAQAGDVVLLLPHLSSPTASHRADASSAGASWDTRARSSSCGGGGDSISSTSRRRNLTLWPRAHSDIAGKRQRQQQQQRQRQQLLSLSPHAHNKRQGERGGSSSSSLSVAVGGDWAAELHFLIRRQFLSQEDEERLASLAVATRPPSAFKLPAVK